MRAGLALGALAAAAAAALVFLPSVAPPGLARSSALLATLRPELEPKIRALLEHAAAAGIPLVVTSATRTAAEQDRLYAQGRTTPGPIVTEVRAGGSYHNFGLAADVALLGPDGPTWPEDDALWSRIGAIGKSLGLTWGGTFPTPDRPHFELRIPGVGPGQSQPIA